MSGTADRKAPPKEEPIWTGIRKKASELSVNWRQHNKHNERYIRMTPRCSAVISRASCNRSFTAASLYAGRAFTQTQQLYTDIHAHVSHSYHLSFLYFTVILN